jgi:hypothetical protein
MPGDLRSQCATFRALHKQGCFVLPNPWDIGGIRRLEKRGFKALASTSAGAAWAIGRNDGELSRDDVLEHLRLLCGATDLPVNADFESGFADEPEGLRKICLNWKSQPAQFCIVVELLAPADASALLPVFGQPSFENLLPVGFISKHSSSEVCPILRYVPKLISLR